uniref:Uncharacterized protein n=1 Tax=Steinernema glaseri TaxID=37863 RepID=A0A1I7Z360_9BILA
MRLSRLCFQKAPFSFCTTALQDPECSELLANDGPSTSFGRRLNGAVEIVTVCSIALVNDGPMEGRHSEEQRQSLPRELDVNSGFVNVPRESLMSILDGLDAETPGITVGEWTWIRFLLVHPISYRDSCSGKSGETRPRTETTDHLVLTRKEEHQDHGTNIIGILHSNLLRRLLDDVTWIGSKLTGTNREPITRLTGTNPLHQLFNFILAQHYPPSTLFITWFRPGPWKRSTRFFLKINSK